MNPLQLIQGSFEKEDALDLITELVQVKIRYHENKIGRSENEEDIERREGRIRQLQMDLAKLREEFNQQSNRIAIQSNIEIA
ncbi:hypothetical protein GCM10027036_26480 [Flavihumibacter cheonanensis]|jgi:hypothetical protein|uniref:Uncharacterized protein n=1 Tax=Flavihumibacter fluminis TaxID=2909236 RepID=A0ABS9BJD8_9BACT|nr:MULTISPECIES: hypothetical protein [Flavihumibacter]MCF1715827.1 hypothetical protein [Flavihumibacter fluminis]MCG7753329.1 hypothetical protein [Flavihumibacter cheonanensis]